MARANDLTTAPARGTATGEKASPTNGGPPSPLLDLLPIRLLREAFRAYPGAFTGMREEGIRRRTGVKLGQIAERFDKTPFAERCKRLVLSVRDAHDAGTRVPHAWIGEVLSTVADTLEDSPFCPANWAVRAEALTLLDYPLHVIGGRVWRNEVGRFYQRFMTRALDEIAQPVHGDELRVWQMYNMGYVVKTRDSCAAFDLHPGVRILPPLSGRQLRRLAECIDLAIVSHDHYDKQYRGFIRRMLQEGKTVVLPGRREPDGDPTGVVRSRDYQFTTHPIGAMGLRACAGWQRGFIRNFVHVLDIGGYRVVHTGDNTRIGTCEELVGRARPDLALVNCWVGFGHLVRRTRPRLVIPGHVNELGHIVSMRCDYGFTIRDLLRQKLPPYDPAETETSCAILTWGEGLVLPYPIGSSDSQIDD